MTKDKKLAEKLKTLPVAPGVYFHKNSDGEVIYVGKAAVLKNRVRQYFQNPEKKDSKTQALIREIADTDWIVVDSEMDALFLESEMIKRYMPKWNILLRDGKTVTYVRIDMKSEIPYVSLTRNPDDDEAEYLGPYYGKGAVEMALRILRRLFPYYDKPYTGKKTLMTDLGLTPGIEVGRMTAAEYKRNLRYLISYLKGNRKKLIRDLELNMQRAAAVGDFERALKYRTQFFGLRALSTKIVFSNSEAADLSNDAALSLLKKMLKMSRPPRRIEGYDISHQAGKDVVGSMVCFINGVADRTQYRRFKLRKQQNNDTASLREVMKRRLRHIKDWGKPNLVIVDGGVAQVEAVSALWKEYGVRVIGRNKSGDHSRNGRVDIILSEDIESDDYELVSLANGSDVAKLIARIDDESHRFAVQYHSLLKRKSALE